MKDIKLIDKSIVIISVILFIIGLFMIGSASYYRLAFYNQSPYQLIIKQAIFICVSLIPFLIIIKIPIKTYKKYSTILIIGIIIALALLKPFGLTVNDSTRWYKIWFFQFQPSEIAKTIIILYFGSFFSNQKNLEGKAKYFTPLLGVLFILGLVLKQPDLGTTGIILLITFFLFLSIPFVKEIKKDINFLMIIGGLILIASVLLFGPKLTNFLKDYQKERLKIANPCQRYYEAGSGFHVCNGYIAINNGGLLGKGFGKSTQKFLYLPEAHTDFIFPIVMEELGLIAAIIIVGLYVTLAVKVLIISRRTEDLMGSIISYGVFLYLMIHLIVNLVGILGILPLTGAPFLFLSYGGTHTINLVICLALVQRVTIEHKKTINKQILEKRLKE